MWRLLLLFSILPIGAALLLRWWFGLRVLESLGGRPCRCDPARWDQALGSGQPAMCAAAAPVGELGERLRLAALAQWQQREPKRAAARESSRRFGLAVPPLSAIVAVFAAILAKIPVTGALVIFIAATALATVFGLLSLGAELRAIALAARNLRAARAFVRSEEEDAVIEAAIARAWCETVPPVLRLL
jgi:cobalamin biosynthesis protein CobD/CbiB